MTNAEVILWSRFKGKQLQGLKFRRQHSIEFYVLDFYCPALKLAIELDGGYHLKKDVQEYDQERQDYIEFLGISFIRFTNKEVCKNVNKVIQKILSTIPSSDEEGCP